MGRYDVSRRTGLGRYISRRTDLGRYDVSHRTCLVVLILFNGPVWADLMLLNGPIWTVVMLSIERCGPL